MTTDSFLTDAPHAVPQEFQVWEDAKTYHRAVFLRCADIEGGSAEQSRLDMEGRTMKGEVDRLEQATRAAQLRAKQQSVEIHLSDDMRETRYYPTEQPSRTHVGFTCEDAAAGWYQVLSLSASPVPDVDTLARIERARPDVISQLGFYWAELANAADIQRVIHQGVHYTRNVLNEGIDSGEQAFRVEQLTADREPTKCDLSVQGRVPVWIHDKLPDNARTIGGLGCRINPSPVVDNSLDDDLPY